MRDSIAEFQNILITFFWMVVCLYRRVVKIVVKDVFLKKKNQMTADIIHSALNRGEET